MVYFGETACKGKAYHDLPAAFKFFIEAQFRTIDVDGKTEGRRGIIQYSKYQSVCPLVRIGPLPLPFLQVSVSPPWNQKGGGQHSLADEGVGGANSDDWRESLALCIFCGGSPAKVATAIYVVLIQLQPGPFNFSAIYL